MTTLSNKNGVYKMKAKSEMRLGAMAKSLSSMLATTQTGNLPPKYNSYKITFDNRGGGVE